MILRNVVFDGHFVTAPVDIHGANWMFYSTKVFKAANLEPPKTWDEFFAQAPKLQAAGYIPLAYGANAQQEGWLFMALLAGVAGSETYLAVAVQHDAKAAGSDGVRKVFETMGRLRQYVDAGSPNRKWNDTLALVETNKAALMIVGDWAKGDLAAANLKIDEDWGCALAPGSQDAYIMQTNSFAFPKTDKPEQIAAQRKLAEVLMDPAVQTEYTFYKGVDPVTTGRQHQVARSLRADRADGDGEGAGAPTAAFHPVVHARCAWPDVRRAGTVLEPSRHVGGRRNAVSSQRSSAAFRGD